ncbi:hypothetical protein Droror1_Dr00024618 [Drosera rotundifolia]
MRFSSLPVFDKPVYDDEGDVVGDDVFGGVERLRGSSSGWYENVFDSVAKAKKRGGVDDDVFGDLLGGLGKGNEGKGKVGGVGGGEMEIPGFGVNAAPERGLRGNSLTGILFPDTAGIAEFTATFLFLYITILTVIGYSKTPNKCATVGTQGIAWAFGGMIFALVYCTAGISGGHINPAVTFRLLLARKLSLTRALFYIIAQVLGAIVGAGVVKGFQPGTYEFLGGGPNVVSHGYTKRDGLGAEIIGTFVLVYTVFSATDAKRSARDSHVPSYFAMEAGVASSDICYDSGSFWLDFWF